MERDIDKLFDSFFDSLSESDKTKFLAFLSFELFKHTLHCMNEFLSDKGSSS